MRTECVIKERALCEDCILLLYREPWCGGREGGSTGASFQNTPVGKWWQMGRAVVWQLEGVKSRQQLQRRRDWVWRQRIPRHHAVQCVPVHPAWRGSGCVNWRQTWASGWSTRIRSASAVALDTCGKNKVAVLMSSPLQTLPPSWEMLIHEKANLSLSLARLRKCVIVCAIGSRRKLYKMRTNVLKTMFNSLLQQQWHNIFLYVHLSASILAE